MRISIAVVAVVAVVAAPVVVAGCAGGGASEGEGEGAAEGEGADGGEGEGVAEGEGAAEGEGVGEGEGEGVAVPEDAAAIIAAFDTGAATSVGLDVPLRADAGEIHRQRDGLADAQTQALVEDGVRDNSIVVDPTCVTFAWTGLTATVTF